MLLEPYALQGKSMDIGDFELLICSPVDKEKLVCAINYQNEFFAEISQETDEFKITIVSCPEDKFWTFSLEKKQKSI